MEVVTFFAVVAVLIILLLNNSKLNGRLNTLFKEIERLRELVSKNERDAKPTTQSPKLEEQVPKLVRPVEKETVKEVKTEVPDKPAITHAQSVTSSYEDTVKAKLEAMKVSKEPASTLQSPVTPKPPKKPTDLEKFVGENLISKLGIIILVLGIGFFVKYAIDQNWIGVYGRAAIGLLTGGIMVSLAHYLRKSYKTFSSLLTGGGFAVFYITIAIAFHQYHIFSQSGAFIIMVLITIFSVLLSLAYDKKELAVFSQFGGYAAPFMVSTGNGNYVVLFTYLLILNAGLLVLAYFKRWHILNLLAYIFTVIIFSGWLATTFWGSTKLPYRDAILFATIFYIVFFLANILNNIKERKPFKAVEIMMILSNNLFYFMWGIVILYNYEKGIYKGLFTVMTGLFNFGWVLYLYHKKQVDKSLIYLLIALVMSYISLAIPIQLNGHSITLFWTAELVILLWLSQVSEIKILKTGHLIILGTVIISIMMDWGNHYTNFNKALPVIFNQIFITGLVLIAGLSICTWLLRKEKETIFVQNIISTAAYRNVLTFILVTATFLIPFLELVYQVQQHYNVHSFQIVLASIYVYAYLFVLLLVTQNNRLKLALKGIFIVSWVALFFYLIVFHLNVLDMRYSLVFSKSVSTANFLLHYLVIPFVVGIVIFLNRKYNLVLGATGFFKNLFIWFISFLLVFMASAELDNFMILISDAAADSYYHILSVCHKVGYPILWGICAFILISFGIKYKNKVYRIQALCLFALIILKLFILDVWNMSEGGRIAAFVFLGVVLLVVSFLYQKLKNLLLESSDKLSKTE